MTHSISMTRYGDWWIESRADTTGLVDYWHKDYPEDDRHGTVGSFEEARQVIDAIEDVPELQNILEHTSLVTSTSLPFTSTPHRS